MECHFRHVRLDVSIILKLILWIVCNFSEFMWLRAGTVFGLSFIGWWTVEFCERRPIFWIYESIVGSGEGIVSTELNTIIIIIIIIIIVSVLLFIQL